MNDWWSDWTVWVFGISAVALLFPFVAPKVKQAASTEDELAIAERTIADERRLQDKAGARVRAEIMKRQAARDQSEKAARNAETAAAVAREINGESATRPTPPGQG